MKGNVKIIGYYRRAKDGNEYILFRQGKELYLTNGICIWRNQFKRIEVKYLPELEKVEQIDMEKMLKHLLRFYEYAEITKKVKELLTNLCKFAIILPSKERRWKMIKTTIRLPEKLYAEMKRKAKKQGLTMNAYVLNVLWASESLAVKS